MGDPSSDSTGAPVAGRAHAPGWRLVGAICLFGFTVRLAAFHLAPGPMHPDEDFQYLEQAHRLVFGSGLVPWEYIVGIRSWLLPGVLAGVFEVARLVGDDPRIGLWMVATLLSLLSLPVIGCSVLWAGRAAGETAAVAAGLLTATWYEVAYLAPHALADSVATSLLIPGLYLVGFGRAPAAGRQPVVGGLLLGLTLAIRLQLAPVVLLAWLVAAWRRQGARVALGIATPLMLAGALDAMTLTLPFQSVWFYFWVNLGVGAAASFGTAPWYFYLITKYIFWSAAALPMIVGILAGSLRRPLLLAGAAAVVVPFTLLAHKEDRFVLPALPLLLTLAGIGSAMIVEHFLATTKVRPWPGGVSIAVGVFWLVLSGAAAATSPLWHAAYEKTEVSNAVRLVNADPAACGVAMYPAEPWARMPGYTRFRPGIGIYALDAGDPPGRSAAYNYIIDDSRVGGDPALHQRGYDIVECWSRPRDPRWPDEIRARACLWHRPGSCDPAASDRFVAPMPAFVRPPAP